MSAVARAVLRVLVERGPLRSKVLAAAAGCNAKMISWCGARGWVEKDGLHEPWRPTAAGLALLAAPGPERRVRPGPKAKPFVPPPKPAPFSLRAEVEAELKRLYRPVTALAVAVGLDRDYEQVRAVLLAGGPWVIAGVCSMGAKWRAA